MKIKTQVRSCLTALIHFFVLSCSDNISSQLYSEDETYNLFISTSDTNKSAVSSLRIYKICNESLWAEEEWLKKNCVTYIELQDQSKLHEIINEFRFPEPELDLGNINSIEPEYHCVFQFKSGKKAYLRLKEDNRNNWIVTAYYSIVYQVRKPVSFQKAIGLLPEKPLKNQPAK